MNLKLLLKKIFFKKSKFDIWKSNWNLSETKISFWTLHCKLEKMVKSRCIKNSLSYNLVGSFLLFNHLEKNEFLLESSYHKHPFNASVTVSTYYRLSDIIHLRLRVPVITENGPGLNTHGEKRQGFPHFTSFCRFKEFLIILLAHINLLFQLCYIWAWKYLGFLAIFKKIFKTGLQITQNLLMFTRQHGLYLKKTNDPL